MGLGAGVGLVGGLGVLQAGSQLGEDAVFLEQLILV